MEDNSSELGALYMDGVEIGNMQNIDLTIENDCCTRNTQFKSGGSFTIDVNLGSEFSNMIRAVIGTMSFTSKLLCNNWRRRHGLPLIRKGTSMYEVKKRSRKTWLI